MGNWGCCRSQYKFGPKEGQGLGPDYVAHQYKLWLKLFGSSALAVGFESGTSPSRTAFRQFWMREMMVGDLEPFCEDGCLLRGAEEGLEWVSRPACGGASSHCQLSFSFIPKPFSNLQGFLNMFLA